MNLDPVTYSAPRWDLSDGSRRVWNVRGLSTVSVRAAQNLLSPYTWATTITIYSANNPNEAPIQVGSLTLTSGAPESRDIDVGTIGYLIFACATAAATSQLVDLSGTGKAKS